MKHGALIHEPEDDVAVVVADVSAGAEVRAVTLEGKEICVVKAIENIALGHKIAVRDMSTAKEIIEYGRTIGSATVDIKQGAHVHTQNIRSVRWA